MAAGRPIVVSDWNGYKELLEDGVQGFKIPTHWGACDTLSRHMGVCAPSYARLYASQTVAVDVDILIERVSVLLKNADYF